MGIICACLPCLKAFAKYHFPGIFKTGLTRSLHASINSRFRSRRPAHPQTMMGTGLTTETLSTEMEDESPLQSKSSGNLLSGGTMQRSSDMSEERVVGVEEIPDQS